MGDRELSAADFHALYERLRGARLVAAAREVQLGRSVTMAAPLAGSAADNPEPADVVSGRPRRRSA